MAIYLIDYENTKDLTGINNLNSDDVVVIFYSQKANALSFDAHREIMASKAKIEYKCVTVGGQNALDFQLSSYLGYLIKQNENKAFQIYIISKDKGFSFVKSFWKQEKSIDILISNNLANPEQGASSDATKPAFDIKDVLKKNEGLELGGVREPLPSLLDTDSAVVEEAARMIQNAKENFIK